MSARHLSCPPCHIRVRADAPEIALLEGRCPVCGAVLKQVSSAADVVGFRSFDLDALCEQEADEQANPPVSPADFVSRRAVSTRDGLDAHRWSDDGGSTAGEAVATRPAAR
jgi:hypothetical protein